jgi:hypothetical protein
MEGLRGAATEGIAALRRARVMELELHRHVQGRICSLHSRQVKVRNRDGGVRHDETGAAAFKWLFPASPRSPSRTPTSTGRPRQSALPDFSRHPLLATVFRRW